MQNIRIFFTKQGPAAYISHLDLQRVMARALRRSKLPVWYSQGFNPHIYMSFSLALPLYQESLVESVDCKTEAENLDFDLYREALNQSLPTGIQVTQIALPQHKSGEIVSALYSLVCPDILTAEKAVEWYNGQENAMVLRKTKRSEAMIDLKEKVPALQVGEPGTIDVRLPAGNTVTYNPGLLLGFLAENGWIVPADVLVIRKKIWVENGEDFC